ncbi:hypothetical protein KVMX100_260035 [Klebsiella variicola]|nr:hypothetical protein KVMX100_260035 [Klebsiella variicola]
MYGLSRNALLCVDFTMRSNEAHLGLKPYIEFLTHLLANVMG